MEKLQIGCPKLRVLRVTNSQISLAPTSLTEQMASPGFPELEELSLAGTEDGQTTSKFIDDNGIERILKCSHRLRLLDVRGCTKITDSGLVKVPAWDLEHLFLSGNYISVYFRSWFLIIYHFSLLRDAVEPFGAGAHLTKVES